MKKEYLPLKSCSLSPLKKGGNSGKNIRKKVDVDL